MCRKILTQRFEKGLDRRRYLGVIQLAFVSIELVLNGRLRAAHLPQGTGIGEELHFARITNSE